MHATRDTVIWVSFLASRVIVLCFAMEAKGDVAIYHRHVVKAAAGANPYEGEEPFGYPPLAFVFVALPYAAAGQDAEWFYQLYRAQCYVVDLLAFYILTRSVRQETYLLAYILGTTLLGNLLYHRLDIVLGLLVILVPYLYERGRRPTACVLLGLSTAFKVIPVVFVPAMLAREASHSWRRPLAASLFVLAGAGTPTAVGYIVWGTPSMLFLGSHGERGVQLESTWASLELLLTEIGALEGNVY